MDEKELVQRCISGDSEAWNAFVEQYIRLIYSVVRRTFQRSRFPYQEDDIEDLSAQFFTNLVDRDFRILRTFKAQSKLSTWLSVIARRLAIDHIRSSKMPAVSLDDNLNIVEQSDNSSAEEAVKQESGEILRQLLNQLSPKEKAIISFFYYEDRNYEEIAGIMNISITDVSTTLYRARLHLKEELEAIGND